MHPIFKKPKIITGNNIYFRDAEIEDAAFIIEIRTDTKKAAFISKTSNDLKQQETWLQNYKKDNEQVYFIILDKNTRRVGTVRLYNRVGESFCWGSWILKEGVPSAYSIESALLVYHFALTLGFEKSHFDVRKGNQSIWKFHERFGATRTKETDTDFFYEIPHSAIMSSLEKYKKYLPNGFLIED
jgi:RimJ/RimL family protein N-acetyltransferase